MRTALVRSSAALLCALVNFVSVPAACADPPEDPSPEEPAPEIEKSDPEALEYLRKAAVRQGAEQLALADGVQSFNVLFKKVWVVQERVRYALTEERMIPPRTSHGLQVERKRVPPSSRC